MLGYAAAAKIVRNEEADVFDAAFEQIARADCSAPVFLHNDYSDVHIFATGAQTTGVIDFEDSASGDPRYDIARALYFQAEPERKAFIAAYGELARDPLIADYMLVIAVQQSVWAHRRIIESLYPKLDRGLQSAIVYRKDRSGMA